MLRITYYFRCIRKGVFAGEREAREEEEDQQERDP